MSVQMFLLHEATPIGGAANSDSNSDGVSSLVLVLHCNHVFTCWRHWTSSVLLEKYTDYFCILIDRNKIFARFHRISSTQYLVLGEFLGCIRLWLVSWPWANHIHTGRRHTTNHSQRYIWAILIRNEVSESCWNLEAYPISKMRLIVVILKMLLSRYMWIHIHRTTK